MTDREAYEARIEAVARAICKARGVDSDASYAINDFYDDGRPEPDVAVPAWRWFRDSAIAADKAVLDAIREPTERMRDEAYEAGASDHILREDGDFTRIWLRVHAAIPRGET